MKPVPAQAWATLLLLAAGLSITPAGADPMRPLPAAGKASTAVAAPNALPRQADGPHPLGRLIAIRQDSQGARRALIGERWVGVGDTLEKARVVAIGANQVELTVAGPTRPTPQTLYLLPPLQAGGSTFGAKGSTTR